MLRITKIYHLNSDNSVLPVREEKRRRQTESGRCFTGDRVAYLRASQSEGFDGLKRVKIVTVGDGEAGKTTLLRSLFHLLSTSSSTTSGSSTSSSSSYNQIPKRTAYVTI